MATRRISVNVRGLWRTEVELKEDAIWCDLKKEISNVTGILSDFQKLEPNDNDNTKCKLKEGDDVFCDWILLPDGCHPLHHAAFKRNIKAIQSWLASGADINVANKNGTTPLMFACATPEKECCVAELLRLGANANAIDATGNTALCHKAAHCHKVDLKISERIAKILIKAGCDPTICNKNGETFIDILKRRYQNKLAKKLEEWLKEME
jgi:hypothetical protein